MHLRAQVVDAALSECMFNMLEGCVPEVAHNGYDRPPSGSTISGASGTLKDTLGVLPNALSHHRTVRAFFLHYCWAARPGLCPKQ